MQAACDIAFEYAHIRNAFGQPIGHFQVKLRVNLIDLYLKRFYEIIFYNN